MKGVGPRRYSRPLVRQNPHSFPPRLEIIRPVFRFENCILQFALDKMVGALAVSSAQGGSF